MLSVTRAAVEAPGKVYERKLTKSSSYGVPSSSTRSTSRSCAGTARHRPRKQLAFPGHWREPDRVFTSPVGGRIYPPDIAKAFQASSRRQVCLASGFTTSVTRSRR